MTPGARGLVTLAIWYAAAVAVPIGLGAAFLGPGFFKDPTDDLVKPCDDPMECGGIFPGAAQVLHVLVPFLLVSLVVAVPVHLLLLRRLSPVAAGSVAPVVAWIVCVAGACLFGVLLRG